jgi:hypothetical protein
LGTLNRWVSGNSGQGNAAQDIFPVINPNETASNPGARKENKVTLDTIFSPQSGFSLLYLIWLIGFSVMFISTAVANILFASRIKKRAIGVKDENILLTFNWVKDKLNIKAQIPIIQTS